MNVNLDELMRLRTDATHGPWKFYVQTGRVVHTTLHGKTRIIADCVRLYNPTGRAKKNAAYITAACNAVPELVARIRELERMCEQQQHRLDFKSAIIAEKEDRHA